MIVQFSVTSFALRSPDVSVSTALPDVTTMLLFPNSSRRLAGSIFFEKRIRIEVLRTTSERPFEGTEVTTVGLLATNGVMNISDLVVFIVTLVDGFAGSSKETSDEGISKGL